MTSAIDAPTLKTWLGDAREIALRDVSEHGQYGSGHPSHSALKTRLRRRDPYSAVDGEGTEYGSLLSQGRHQKS
jgi:hypothetical protein